MSEVTTEDLYEKMSSVVNLLEDVTEELQLIRLATYGQTAHESGKKYDNPKHGDFGAIAESPLQLENMIMNIEHTVLEEARKR